ncbi:hypothetical protein [Methylobacterium radiotolerans]|nr:hypothetical protein [Methylobacterium radiotolerans]
MQHDLILQGARVIDRSQNHDASRQVSSGDGRISGYGRGLHESLGP